MSTTSTESQHREGGGHEDRPDDTAAARALGEALRSVRRGKHLSLRAVEDATGQEFKASVLGAYERGDRIISVPRVQRLARYYGVPVDRLLSGDGTAGTEPRAADDVTDVRGHVDLAGAERGEQPSDGARSVSIDLNKVEALPAVERELLHRYLMMIQSLRGHGDARRLTVRSDDVRIIATLLHVPPSRIPDLLELIAVTSS